MASVTNSCLIISSAWKMSFLKIAEHCCRSIAFDAVCVERCQIIAVLTGSEVLLLAAYAVKWLCWAVTSSPTRLIAYYNNDVIIMWPLWDGRMRLASSDIAQCFTLIVSHLSTTAFRCRRESREQQLLRYKDRLHSVCCARCEAWHVRSETTIFVY